MLKSLSVSSESSFDDVDSVSSDELLGSQSRRWLAELMTGDLPSESGELRTVDRDGLFVDYQFPVGELELQSGVRWKRPKVEIMTAENNWQLTDRELPFILLNETLFIVYIKKTGVSKSVTNAHVVMVI